MLTIVVPGTESFDQESQEFLTTGDVVLQLEHSLVTLSKWESIFEKSFLSTEEKSSVETLGYIRAMVLTPNLPEDIFERLTQENMDAISDYIDAPMTATTVHETPGAPKARRETVTAELIYYWMIVYNIPKDCENWHLNRLIALIRVCNAKNEKPKKRPTEQVAAQYRDLNAQRKAQMGTKG